MTWFEARFAGVCDECGGPIVVGQAIESLVRDRKWRYRHVHCPVVPAVELRVSEVVCGSCFMVRPCPCDDGQAAS